MEGGKTRGDDWGRSSRVIRREGAVSTRTDLVPKTGELLTRACMTGRQMPLDCAHKKNCLFYGQGERLCDRVLATRVLTEVRFTFEQHRQ